MATTGDLNLAVDRQVVDHRASLPSSSVRARQNTPSSIAAVRRPVFVFCCHNRTLLRRSEPAGATATERQAEDGERLEMPPVEVTNGSHPVISRTARTGAYGSRKVTRSRTRTRPSSSITWYTR